MRGLIGVVAFVAACGGDRAPMAQEAKAMPGDTAMSPSLRGADRVRPSPSGGSRRARASEPMATPTLVAAEEEDRGGRVDDDESGSEGGGATVRQWFPESFLWRPLVQTDDQGLAVVDVVLPDQLTTWRVLGLAHDRGGFQAGDVHTFDTRLPAYVSPVLPAQLYAGDRVQIPVQVASMTADALAAHLSLSGSGVLEGSAEGDVVVPAFTSAVRYVALEAVGAGAGGLHAALGDLDAVDRSIAVSPTGRPVQRLRGGVLERERSLVLPAEPGADPATEQLVVMVMPGPLAAVEAEVARTASVGLDVWSAAYGMALSHHLATLATSLGVSLDDDVVRALRLRSWQRVVGYSRAPDLGQAVDLLLGLHDVADFTPAEVVRERLISQVVGAQRGDGTWARSGRESLQQVLVDTALTARVLPPSEVAARTRAAGALERLARDPDAFTAAVLLASGVVEDALRPSLLAVIQDALVVGDDGTPTVALPADVRTAWGTRPSQAEMVTWTALALLEADEAEVAGELVATLMSAWSAAWGFGAGPADALALEAVTRALPSVASPATVSLDVDGHRVAEGRLDPGQPRLPVVLSGAPGGGPGAITLSVDPPVPGLAYLITRRSWVPWGMDEAPAGVDVEVGSSDWRVGVDAPLTLTLSAPSGVALQIEQGLPSGTTVDDGALAALRGDVVHTQIVEDRVLLTTRVFRAGEVMSLALVVRPAFAGTFSTRPLRVTTLERGAHTSALLPPEVWHVRAP